MQSPALQVLPTGHTLSHAPQLSALVIRFTQLRPHCVAGHVSTHALATQN
jgi:hypothetical protein